MEAIFHGIILAFGLILPLGVQNIFIFSQGVTQSRFDRALPAAVTASICDTILIVLAVFGLSLIVLQFEWLRLLLLGCGILFLIYMGWVIWKSGAAKMEGKEAMPAKKQIMFALSVSLLNPHALLDTIGVIGTSAMAYRGVEQLYFTAACVIVSWLWFFGLALTGATMKKMNVSDTVFIMFNKLSSLFIWGTALYLVYGFVNAL